MLSNGPGKGTVVLGGGVHGPRGRKAAAVPWTRLLILGAVTFLAGYLVGAGVSRDVSRGGSSDFEASSLVSGETGTLSELSVSTIPKTGGKSRKATDARKGLFGNRHTSTNAYKNMTFEEIISLSGALDDHPALPASEIGKTGHPFYTVQPMQLLSWYPRAYLFPKFIDRDMAQHVIDLASSRMSPSSLALREGETLQSTREIRTSQGTFLSRGMDSDGILAYIEDKIAVMTGIPAGHGEAFNVLRYAHGQHYDAHYDAFDEESYGKQSSQRIATVLVYLTDVEEGGETSFLFEGVGGTERISTVDYKKCDTGIKYKPRAGDALLFWSIHPDLTRDKHSLHGGCPVVKGTKWTATKWIRDRCLGGVCSSGSVN